MIKWIRYKKAKLKALENENENHIKKSKRSETLEIENELIKLTTL